ncbi:MAG: HAD family phosphatase [Clostridiaceae bacterium]|nr:HAD family phosphatase [Clostridiaceae bacterium]
MKIEGAIFDLDGTLLDSMFIWDTIGEDYLRTRGIEPRENLNERFKNMSLYQAACYYQTEYGLTESTDTIMADINDMIHDFYIGEVRPKMGVPQVLEELGRRKVKMCIATATDRHLVEAALGRLGLLSYFGDIFTCSSVGYGKDEPYIYNTAHSFLQTPKDVTWVFEDALYAVKTAKKAGYHVVGVFDRSSGHDAEIKSLADIYIGSFKEMEDILNEKDTYNSRF